MSWTSAYDSVFTCMLHGTGCQWKGKHRSVSVGGHTLSDEYPDFERWLEDRVNTVLGAKAESSVPAIPAAGWRTAIPAVPAAGWRTSIPAVSAAGWRHDATTEPQHRPSAHPSANQRSNWTATGQPQAAEARRPHARFGKVWRSPDEPPPSPTRLHEGMPHRALGHVPIQ